MSLAATLLLTGKGVMKRAVSILAVAFLFAMSLAAQEILYDNGPDPGNIFGWAISDGYWVANSFTLESPAIISAINVSLYDVNWYNYPLSLDWKIYDRLNGHVLASGSGSRLHWVSGPFDTYFLLQQWEMQFNPTPPVPLRAGTYWLQLSNAVNTWNTPTWWGECDGASKVLFNGMVNTGYWKHHAHSNGGSESFQILGTSIRPTLRP